MPPLVKTFTESEPTWFIRAEKIHHGVTEARRRADGESGRWSVASVQMKRSDLKSLHQTQNEMRYLPVFLFRSSLFLCVSVVNIRLPLRQFRRVEILKRQIRRRVVPLNDQSPRLQP